jgi:hypothetical protein
MTSDDELGVSVSGFPCGSPLQRAGNSVQVEPGQSSSSLNMDEDNAAGGSISLLKRKRGGSDIVAQDGSYPTMLGVF